MTVSELNIAAKAQLEALFSNITLTGELSRITKHSSGHWYFDLKDERAAIACAMFKGANSKVDFIPVQGDKLELFGSVSLYEASGRYQFLALKMKKAGQGDLEERFLKLKASLEKEGLFDKNTSLPLHPKKVGFICSPTSAALADMLRLIEAKANFLPKFYIYPCLTQGENAPASMITALKRAEKDGLDVLILARGGGSREDLFCFNDEGLARQIYSLKTPLISAIGHEIDYVISDFVADFRAPTPSAAINILLKARSDLDQELDLLQTQFLDLIKAKFKLSYLEYERLLALLAKSGLGPKIARLEDNLTAFSTMFKTAMKERLARSEAKLDEVTSVLNAHESFFKKSQRYFTPSIDGKPINPDDLMAGMDLELISFKRSFKARLLSEL